MRCVWDGVYGRCTLLPPVRCADDLRSGRPGCPADERRGEGRAYLRSLERVPGRDYNAPHDHHTHYHRDGGGRRAYVKNSHGYRRPFRKHRPSESIGDAVCLETSEQCPQVEGRRKAIAADTAPEITGFEADVSTQELAGMSVTEGATRLLDEPVGHSEERYEAPVVRDDRKAGEFN
jgi:hypothetical protein